MDQAALALRKLPNIRHWLGTDVPPASLPSKPERPFEKTYRVQGIPDFVDRARLQSVLNDRYKLGGECDQENVRIESLAKAPDGKTLIATISFFAQPSTISKACKDEITMSWEDPEQLNHQSYTLTIDSDFLGLTTLYCPEDKDHKVDIIAVSGLGGHAFGSFKERGGNHMWVRDALPKDLKTARVFIYGYDAHLTKSESFQDLEDLSSTFRQSVQAIKRDRNSPKPLIYIAHSLGGLLVKEMLYQMHRDPEEGRRILRSTYGLLFFGVPNRGMDIESLLPMVKGQPNETFLRSLERHTQLLRAQSRTFPEIFNEKGSKVICFYETLLSETATRNKETQKWEMKGEKKVLVDRDSATHGRPHENQPHHAQPINRNHSDMVKYHQNDQYYKLTLKILQDFVEGSSNFLMSRNRYLTDEEAELETDICKWLSPPKPRDNYLRARDAHEEDTGKWIFDTANFQKWKLQGGVLWICGIPGAGKTIISSTVINSIQGDSRFIMAYYFFDFNNDEKQTLRGLLLSLLEQLSKARTQISASLKSLYAEYQSGQRASDTASLKETILSVLNEHVNEGSKHIFLMIDALDECKEDDIVLKFIKRLQNTYSYLHIYIASRPKQEIKLHMEGLQASTVILNDVNGVDIEMYVSEQLESRALLRHTPQEIKDRIHRTLIEKASGMFRWVTCQFDTLEKCQSRKDFIHALENLPPTLDETYRRALEGIEDHFKNHALRIFQWLVFSKRPLTLLEAAEIIAIGSSPNSGFDIDSRLINPRSILKYLGNLVTVQSWRGVEQLRLAHFSVQEYFLSDRIDENWNFERSNCHQDIASTSLNYLISLRDLDCTDDIGEIEAARPLSEYTAKFWSDHCRVVDEYQAMDEVQTTELRDRIILLFKDRTLLEIWIFICTNDDTVFGLKTLPSPLYYASYFGLYHVAKACLQGDINWVAEKSKYNENLTGSLGFPLAAASCYGNRAIVELLLANGADINLVSGHYGTALATASFNGERAIVELLLANGADINLVSGHYGTALATASFNEKRAIVELLLANGADINLVSGHYGTALATASCYGERAIVELLLANGADINLVSGNYGTALATASLYGERAIVELLLANGADINLVSGHYGTALIAASYNGPIAIVELLLASGADINLVGGNYGTALAAASYSGRRAIVELLLANGADINLVSGHYGTALAAASYSGQRAIVELLLANGADIDLAGGVYGTALAAASYRGRTTIVKFLLDARANINAESQAFVSPLQATLSFRSRNPHFRKCSQTKALKLAKLLISSGVEVNAARHLGDQKYESALKESVKWQRPSRNVLHLLLTSGVSIHKSAESHQAAMATAGQMGHSWVITLLQRVQEVDEKPLAEGLSRVQAIDDIFISMGNIEDIENDNQTRINRSISGNEYESEWSDSEDGDDGREDSSSAEGEHEDEEDSKDNDG
ncbi:hypothetical protein BP5796_10283 [Coleophoma crateriformis]|uniref:Uncharacterized protein n=1 Tax=Coleophoma crateriformis TaxID=565419 RepID=A0A3D8QV78_9HELO|nr:hypothetical protein BP5796_10283 [Coleophoma crateriformis]